MLRAGEQNQPGLKRNVGLFQAVMYGIGLILGAGIYVLIGDVAGIAGNAMWISLIIAAAIAIFTGLSYAELSSMFPRSAAEYVFVKNAFKNDLMAFVAGWLIIFVAIASAAAVALGFSGYLLSFFPQADPVLSAVALVMALSAVNYIGIRESTWLNTAFTFVELAGLAIVVIAALFLGSFGEERDYLSMPQGASASIPLAIGAILGAAGLAFFAYFGFENLANIADEAKDANRTIPKALLISIAATTVIYIVISLSAIALVGWESLSSTDAPLALAAEKAFGKTGVAVLSAIALFATSNTVLMMMVAGSRIMYGMSKERALPSLLGTVKSSTGTPWIAVVLTALLVTAVLSLSQGSIYAVANVAVFVIFMVYAVVNMALIWLRYRQPNFETRFRSPATIGRLPVFAALGLMTTLAMLTQFDSITVAAGFAVAATGFASYAAISRYRNVHKSESR